MTTLKTYRESRGENYTSYNGDPWADWFVVVGTYRDADCLQRSNFRSAVAEMPADGEGSEDWVTPQASHWAVGWVQVLLVRPGTECARIGAEIVEALEQYPVLNEDDHSKLEREEADEIWANLYSVKERIEYIRKASLGDFEFRSLADMLGCVRGKYFAGCASELIS